MYYEDYEIEFHTTFKSPVTKKVVVTPEIKRDSNGKIATVGGFKEIEVYPNITNDILITLLGIISKYKVVQIKNTNEVILKQQIMEQCLKTANKKNAPQGLFEDIRILFWGC